METLSEFIWRIAQHIEGKNDKQKLILSIYSLLFPRKHHDIFTEISLLSTGLVNKTTCLSLTCNILATKHKPIKVMGRIFSK